MGGLCSVGSVGQICQCIINRAIVYVLSTVFMYSIAYLTRADKQRSSLVNSNRHKQCFKSY